MPTLRQLEYLVALAETKHFRRAAERVNTTQPTLSEQIKSLEERLCVQLVERSTARVLLTPIGNEVVEIARRMLKDAREIRNLAASDAKGLRGLLRLGLPPTIGPYLLQRAAPKLHRAYPALRLYVREDLPQVLPRLLEEGFHDVIICPMPIKGAEIESVVLFREPLLLTVGSDHPLAGKKSVALADIEGQDVLTLGPGHQLHDAAIELCKASGARLRYDFEGTSLDMLREMVVMGLGITFMPGLYARSELAQDKDVRLLEVRDRSLFRTLGMAWRKSASRTATFIELADFFKGMIEPGLERRR
ncbi:hydrogen peroxide-inducible genes activator [Hyphomicrobium sp.]|uniref:hydrogen peroxide-inducible genes activator n=1 Tax=Hyphomicrobium sp. TaxID=82 RepID=UPI002E3129EE|nr:hydrogen peroxide-inducible genes activator [Hyphomicrobium sp.]HEX2841415.1 hydrogen peroxide-inducible genes activator [Hyphomicrobium sp.]